MKLKKATIYGFGKWVDFTIDFTDESFISIYGENESGKSSIQRFIMFMLFGLPPKKRAFYRPKTSSKMGGRLTLIDPTIGEFTIERFDDKWNGAAVCYTEDGQYDEKWLKDLLSGINRKMYESIYTFSALDLNQIQSMKEEDIGEVLFSIGLTGSTQIYSLEKKLEQDISELFKPTGKKPTINLQLNKIKELHHQLIEKKNDESKYEEKKYSYEQILNSIELLKGTIKSKKETLLTLEKQMQALPSLYDFISYQNELHNLPKSSSFPEDGINRLQHLKENMIPLTSEKKLLLTNEQKYKKEIEQLQYEIDRLIPFEEEAKSFQGSYSAYREHLVESNQLQESIQKHEQQIQTELQALNIGLTVHDMESLELPFHLEQTWNDLRKKKEQLSLEKEKLTEEKKILNNKQHVLENQIYEVKQKRYPQNEIEKLKKILDKYQENKMLEKLQEETIAKQEKWKKDKLASSKKSSIYLSISLILAISFGLLAYVTDQTLLMSVSIGIIVLGVGQWIWNRNSMKDMEKMISPSTVITPKTTMTEQEKYEVEKVVRDDKDLSQQYEDLQNQKRNNDLQEIQWDEKNTIFLEKEKNLKFTIDEQREGYPFLQNLDVVYWPELYQSLKGIIRIQHQQTELGKRLTKVNKSLARFSDNLQSFMNNMLSISEQKNVDVLMEHINNTVSELNKKKDNIAHYEELMDENQEQLLKINQQMNEFEIEANRLFQAANVHTEEEFYKKARELSRRQELQEACENIRNQYSTYFSEDEWNQLINRLPKESTLKLSLNETKSDSDQLELELEEKRQQLANLKIELENLESAENYSKSLHEFEMEQEYLNQLAKKWAIHQTAKQALIETRNEYRDKYLSKVMELTSKYFQYLTDGAYKRVHPPENGNLFRVESSEQIHFEVNELSQGTINQLYVALRIAISEIMSKETRLPFIIDDAFVHFDKSRTKLIIDLLRELANDNQVILFTCKKEVKDFFSPQNSINLTTLVPLTGK
ncbi:ATP-binding protein [Ornithinibacillus halophilus]|uniref:Uncharacterized protein YhaN n=1 Tax=Ornithinibacillus halophilus TaxID=930117 RepID=A0A1M5LPK1_9BACI|nr:AAA family ATPase [Ornithinibacillus halophilus]SHG67072.1 Uncharacterized protein YhaN [Ornithinibacillus halophilus]